VNLYRYMSNSPIGFVDPTGLIKENSGAWSTTYESISVKDLLGKAFDAVTLNLFAKNERTLVQYGGYDVKDVVDNGKCKCKCKVSYLVQLFFAEKVAVKAMTLLDNDGIETLRILLKSLKSDKWLKDNKLDGKIEFAEKISHSESHTLEGKCADLTIEKIAEVFGFATLKKEVDVVAARAKKDGKNFETTNAEVLAIWRYDTLNKMLTSIK